MITTNVYIDWTPFKNYIIATLVPFKMIESDTAYDLLLSDEALTASCRIVKDGGADQTDFETNYKSRANADYPEYSTVLNITQTTNTAANNTVFAMRNAVGSNRTVVIKKIFLNMSFDQGTPLTGPASLRYYLCGFANAT